MVDFVVFVGYRDFNHIHFYDCYFLDFKSLFRFIPFVKLFERKKKPKKTFS